MKTFSLQAGGALAEVIPERGALCTRLRLGGDELLFLDPATLALDQNVRGGIPVLFPNAGVLPGNTWIVHGAPRPMPKHGFARKQAWEVAEAAADRLTCVLRSSDATRESFPWEFEARLSFALSPGALRLEFALRNASAEPLPWQLGFHPYFHVSEKGRARVETSATRAFDNVAAVFRDYQPPDFATGETDLYLLDHREPGTVFHRGAEPAVRLRWSPEFKLLVNWTLPGRPFICVEPWTAPPGALASGDGLLHVAPGATGTAWFELSLA